MELPPLIERELRVALRRQSPRKLRFWVTLGAVVGAGIVMPVSALTQSAGAGRTLFMALLGCALAGVLEVPRAMAGAFAAERENQTLGLLMLSGLHPAEVFFSKVISAALVSTTLLLTLTPFLAVPFLAGGISHHQFLATLIALPNLLLLATSVSLAAAVACADTGTAQFTAKISLAAICLVPLAVHFAQETFSGAATPSPRWLWASPAFVPWTLFWGGAGSRGWFPGFWPSTLITLTWSSGSLLVAVWTLRRFWQAWEGPVGEGSWRRRWHSLVHGTVASRRRLALRCLEVNPFLWLAARDRGAVFWAWLTVGALAACWLTGCLLWPARWPSAPNFLITSTLLCITLGTFMSHATAATLAALRRNGELEQLLCTPLEPGAMVWGQIEAVRRQFNAIWWTLLALHLAMLVAGWFYVRSTFTAKLVYVVWYALLLGWHLSLRGESRARLLALWLGLHTGRVRWAMWKSSGFGGSIWSWWWIFFNLRRAVSGARNFPSGSTGELVLAGFITLVVLAAWLTGRMRRRELANRLIFDFREVAREPIPAADDPRLKRWQLDQRLPLDEARLQGELVERVVRRNQPPRR
jgi:ABC-type transport system involved in cytochrome c biogenesis permease component